MFCDKRNSILQSFFKKRETWVWIAELSLFNKYIIMEIKSIKNKIYFLSWDFYVFIGFC